MPAGNDLIHRRQQPRPTDLHHGHVVAGPDDHLRASGDARCQNMLEQLELTHPPKCSQRVNRCLGMTASPFSFGHYMWCPAPGRVAAAGTREPAGEQILKILRHPYRCIQQRVVAPGEEPPMVDRGATTDFGRPKRGLGSLPVPRRPANAPRTHSVGFMVENLAFAATERSGQVLRSSVPGVF